MNGEPGAPAPTLAQAVADSVGEYFTLMDDEEITGVYDLVMTEVERALFARALAECNYNQSRCALMLGVSRGTLRTKLRRYGIRPDRS